MHPRLSDFIEIYFESHAELILKKNAIEGCRMINSGVPITTIAARLGHADPTTTTKIYTHAIQFADAAAADQLDMIFTNRKPI